MSLAIGKLEVYWWEDKKVPILTFSTSTSYNKTWYIKLFLPDVRQTCPQTFLVFTLEQKDPLGMRLVQ